MMDQHLIAVVWGSGGSVTLYLKKLFSKFVCFPNLGRGQVTLTSHQSPPLWMYVGARLSSLSVYPLGQKGIVCVCAYSVMSNSLQSCGL